MTPKFASSQILTPLILNQPPKYLSCHRQTKFLLLPWKFQKTPTKMLVKGRRLKLSKARIKARIRRKFLLIPSRRPQILLSLSPTKLLTQGFPRRKFRLGVFSQCNKIFFFCYVYCVVFSFKEMYHLFLLSMKMSFFRFIHHDMCYKIRCQSMATFCHFNLNKIYRHIV